MPKRVYKYLSAQYAIDDLKKRRIKIATIDDLNDPFDLGPIDTSHPTIDKAVREIATSFRGDTGLLCFSRVWDNILMWSHYGNSHTGVCLGFDIAGDRYDMEVVYQPSPLQIRTKADVNFDFAQRMLRTKYEVWSYEQELRMFVKLNDPPDADDLNWFDFGPDLELKEVIMGLQCSAKDNAAVGEAIKDYKDPPERHWAYMRAEAFALIRKAMPHPWLNSRHGLTNGHDTP
jgi:hypothetical protein